MVQNFKLQSFYAGLLHKLHFNNATLAVGLIIRPGP